MTSKQIETIEEAAKCLYFKNMFYKVHAHEDAWEFVFYRQDGRLIANLFVKSGLLHGKVEITPENVKFGFLANMLSFSVVKK